jgi:hypothetical protein
MTALPDSSPPYGHFAVEISNPFICWTNRGSSQYTPLRSDMREALHSLSLPGMPERRIDGPVSFSSAFQFVDASPLLQSGLFIVAQASSLCAPPCSNGAVRRRVSTAESAGTPASPVTSPHTRRATGAWLQHAPYLPTTADYLRTRTLASKTRHDNLPTASKTLLTGSQTRETRLQFQESRPQT